MSRVTPEAGAIATRNFEGIHLVDTATEPLNGDLGTAPYTARPTNTPLGTSATRLETDLKPREEMPVLFCLHGIGSCSRAFTAQMADLSGEFRLVAWDAPGYGKSADPDEALDLNGYVEKILHIGKGLGERVHLLGVSFGGVLALATALADPSFVASAVLIGASRGSGRSASSATAVLDRVDQLERLGPVAFAKERAPVLLSTAAPASLVQQVVDTMAEAVRLPGYRWAAETMAATDLTVRLADVHVPVMVIYGEEDRVTGRAEGEILSRSIPGAVSVSIVHAGHLANQEQPASVNDWIAAFIQIVERLSPASRTLYAQDATQTSRSEQRHRPADQASNKEVRRTLS